MKRTDVPLDGIETVRTMLEYLDYAIGRETEPMHSPSVIRTMVLGILARVDAAITDIKDSDPTPIATRYEVLDAIEPGWLQVQANTVTDFCTQDVSGLVDFLDNLTDAMAHDKKEGI